jgi:uncharacterized glyoxalase superfamily protein PhnB
MGLRRWTWLAGAFGFHEMTRMLGNERTLAHGELETGDGLIMLAMPSPDYKAHNAIVKHAKPLKNGQPCRG